MIYLIPYKFGSASAKALQLNSGGLVRRLSRRKLPLLKYNSNNLYINWGCTSFPLGSPYPLQIMCLNRPNNVLLATNKLLTLRGMVASAIKCPTFTVDKQVAVNWNCPVIGRTDLFGTGGKDAYYFSNSDELNQSNLDFKLFLKYINKTHEYRVHVFMDEAICIQQKRKRLGQGADYKIRNHDRGWVFCRKDIDNPPVDLINQSVNAVNRLGLDFGAVDVVWDSRTDEIAVLEINTAPGIQGSTVVNYLDAIKRIA